MKEIPVVIEPGIAVLEAVLTITDKQVGERTVSAHFFRLDLTEKIAPALPLVPTIIHPHVFSLHEELERSPLLLVYDHLGRLALVYHRDTDGRSWERKDVAAELVGRSVTQFSVRFCFAAAKDRSRFVSLMDNMVTAASNGETISKGDMKEAVTILGKSRVPPVLLPVAVAKADLKDVPT